MELLFFLLVVAGLILIPERRRKVRSEKNRRNKAIRIEVTRTITNPKLADIDTYVYLLVRQHTTLIRKEDRYLKIGIGSHERVKKQLSEQNTYLLKLYMFRSRRNAFQVEQKILQKWNNKFVGNITTQSGIGTEYIKFTLGNLKTALSILSRYEENLIESNKLLIQKLEVNESTYCLPIPTSGIFGPTNESPQILVAFPYCSDHFWFVFLEHWAKFKGIVKAWIISTNSRSAKGSKVNCHTYNYPTVLNSR